MDLNRPNPFTPNKTQIAKDWQIWKQEFLIYLRLSGGYDKYNEEDRALLLINLMGTEALIAMDKMTFDDESEKNDMDIMIMKFDEIFDPPLNEVEERYKFFSRRKSEKETIESYIMDLKEKATKCNFGVESEQFIMDMVIRNMDNYLRKIIFQLEDLTLPDLVQRYKQYVISTDKIKELSKNLAESMNDDSLNNTTAKTNTSTKQSQLRKPCWFCGTHHNKGSCPAYGKICTLCNEKNHFSNFCKNKSANSVKTEENKQKSTCSKCGTYHPYKQCPANEENKQKPICSKCGTYHPYRQCPENEENKQKPICSKCGTNHPFRQCPAYEENKQKAVCSKCGTNHPFGQCPAYQETCQKCFTKGHYTHLCKQNNSDNKSYDSTNKRDVDTQSSAKKLEYCLWCEKKHSLGECLHDVNCTRCYLFPHNICFQCKKNPHDNNCYFKSIVTLPTQVPFCHHCRKSGHTKERCYLLLSSKQHLNIQSKTTSPDSSFNDFVKVENTQPHQPQFQRPRQTHSSQYRKNNFESSKTKPKPETCSIS